MNMEIFIGAQLCLYITMGEDAFTLDDQEKDSVPALMGWNLYPFAKGDAHQGKMLLLQDWGFDGSVFREG